MIDWEGFVVEDVGQQRGGEVLGLQPVRSRLVVGLREAGVPYLASS